MSKKEELYSKAILFWESNNFLESRNIFKKILKKDPANPEINSFVGILDLQMGNYENGIKQLRKAYLLSPNDQNIKINLSNGLLNMANQLIEKDKDEDAIAVLKESLEIFPFNEGTYENLLRLNIKLKDFKEAKNNFLSLIKINPKNPNSYYLYGNALFDIQKYQFAINSYEKAIEIKNDFYECYFHQALSYEFQGNISKALEKYDECLAIKPDYDLATFNKAQLFLTVNEFTLGWKLYKKRWATKKNLGKYLYNPENELKDSTQFDKRIFVWAEQGVGDQILFSSMLNDFKNLVKNLVVSIDKRLIKIYERSFPGIQFIERESNSNISFDYHLPIGNIGQFVRENIKDFENQKKHFLFSNHKKKNFFINKLSSQHKKICGLSWTSKNELYGKNKSLFLEDIARHLPVENFKYVNLEYVNNQNEVDDARKNFLIDIVDTDNIDKFNDLDSFAALVSACDLIVTISNVTAHFAGSLGVKTLLLVPYAFGRFWYWSDLGQSKWYPSIKILRQKEPNSWDSTLKDIQKIIINS